MPQDRVHSLIRDYFAGDVSPEKARALEEWVREDPANARTLAEFVMLDGLLLINQKNMDSTAVFASLLEAEENAPLQLVDLTPQTQKPSSAQQHEDLSISFRELCSLAGYVSREALRKPGVVKGLVAAVLLIAGMLAITLSIANYSDPENEVVQGSADDAPSLLPAPLVATLTAELDAVWERQPGEDLYAGQRLTLTAGFAELTTKQGAIAILEAPATIELLDHDNALRLHRGKLVGICETKSSKGFTVRTPHMNVIDLGTRFGVDASARRQTEVHVFEGEVSLTQQAIDGQTILREQLKAGSAVAYGPVEGLAMIDLNSDAFIADLRMAALRPDFAGTNSIWLGQASGDLGQNLRKSDALQVFLERSGLILQQDVAVDFNRESEWAPHTGVGMYRVAAGERVDVYLLHFDLANGHDQPEHLTLDFGRPILGVIGTQTVLDQTDDPLGTPGVSYPVFDAIPLMPGGGHRGLNYRPIAPNDETSALELKNDLASISPDGTTLELRLWGGEVNQGAKMDQVRVLVRSLDADEQP